MDASSALTALPDECALHILKFLAVGDIIAVAACCTGLRQLVADDHTWAELADAKWGPAVRELKPLADADQDARRAAAGTSAAGTSAAPAAPAGTAPAPLGSWQRFCYKRLSARTIKPSPLALGQESYPDPWQHVCCCVLCSRTSGGPLIKTTIAAFFSVCPTPSAVLDVPDDALMELLHPLGLQASRAAALKSVAHGWLATDFDDPSEFKGCGKFVTDSWRVFCRGLRDAKDITDTSLRAYLSWLQREERQLDDSDEQEAMLRQQRQRAQSSQRKQRQQQQQGRPATTTTAGMRLTRTATAAAVSDKLPAAQPAKRTRAAAAAVHPADADAAPKGSRAAGKRDQRSVAAASRPGKAQQQQQQQQQRPRGRAQRHQPVAV